MIKKPSYYQIGDNEEVYIDSFIGCELFILPDTPTNYSKIRITDIGNKLNIHPCTIKHNNHFINNKKEDLILTKNGIRIILQYIENEGYTVF